MDGVRAAAGPGPMGRYLSGLCVAGLGLCGAGWLVLTPFAFGYQGRGWHRAMLTDLATGGALAVVCVITLVAWAAAWRRALRADGMLGRPERGTGGARRRRDRGGARRAGAADPEQVLTALRALLAPMLDPSAEGGTDQDATVAAVIPGPRSAPAGETRVASPGSRVAVAEPRVAVAEPAAPQVNPAGPEGIAVIESMLAGAELLMTGRDEEEAW